jgi:mortality factor 4-like protein 1
VDDWENVTKNNQVSYLAFQSKWCRKLISPQLVSLPRKPNVRELLEDYRVYVESTKKTQDRTP